MIGEWTPDEENTLYKVLRSSAQDNQVSNSLIWDDILGTISEILTYGYKKGVSVTKVKRKV